MKNLSKGIIILLVLALFGCAPKNLKVKAEGFDNVKKGYAEGEEVEIYFSNIGTDTDYRFFVDGTKYNASYDNAKGYVIKFTMPDHDVEVSVKIGGSMMMDPAQGVTKILYQRLWFYALEGETEDKEKIAEIMNALNSLVISDESTAISYEDNGERIFVYYDNGETKTYYFEDNFYVDTATSDHYLVISGMRELRMAVYELIGVEYVDY